MGCAEQVTVVTVPDPPAVPLLQISSVAFVSVVLWGLRLVLVTPGLFNISSVEGPLPNVRAHPAIPFQLVP